MKGKLRDLRADEDNGALPLSGGGKRASLL